MSDDFLPDGVEITGSLVVWAGDFQEGIIIGLDSSTVDALNRRMPRAWRTLITVIEHHLKARS